MTTDTHEDLTFYQELSPDDLPKVMVDLPRYGIEYRTELGLIAMPVLHGIVAGHSATIGSYGEVISSLISRVSALEAAQGGQ